MKQFSCGAVVPGCMATFTEETEDQIFASVAAHAQKDHGLESVSDELVAAVRANIITIAA
jgi:predicted small metal-binding protein